MSSRRSGAVQPGEGSGACGQYSHARISSVFSTTFFILNSKCTRESGFSLVVGPNLKQSNPTACVSCLGRCREIAGGAGICRLLQFVRTVCLMGDGSQSALGKPAFPVN